MSADLSSDPRREYQLRLESRGRTVNRFERLEGRISTARGIVFVAGIAMLLVPVNSSESVSPWWLLLPATVFVGLIVFHARVVHRLERSKAAVEYFRTALDRLDDNWSGTGAAGLRYADPQHPYSGDLDLFGPGSLFQLISRARSRLGEDTLAEWFSAPADAQTIRTRQQAVYELRLKLDLREKLALLDAEVHDDLNQNHLLRWSAEPPVRVGLLRRVTAVVLSMAAVCALAAWLLFEMGVQPLLLVLLVQVPFLFSFARQVRHFVGRVDEAGSGLAILSQVLEVFEAERFSSKFLSSIQTRLETDGVPPSRRIVQLSNLIQRLHNSLQNQFFAPIGFLLGLSIHVVHSIQQWRTRFGPRIPEWLTAVGELEALSALAGYVYEHPDDRFPEIVDNGPVFDGEQLGHPLLPQSSCVRNDVTLDDDLRLLLISGSNMSGKSTLLRAIGSNVVLALAGAPVRAKRLRISTVMVGTSMRINDSLQQGRSQFYAALSRLKSIVDLAGGDRPLLFLLDEILQGTNSHDRRVGSEAVIHTLLQRGAIGLVTTHDLALTIIVEPLGSRASNIHFEDGLADGQMTFDYRIRPGVVQKSNAQELMRQMGLQLEEP